MNLAKLDIKIIDFFRKISVPSARIGLFVVFFWFGLLKIIGLSPASGVVQRLFEGTIPFIEFSYFFLACGLFEMLIGLLFLIRGFERVVIPLLFIHMFTTLGPLVLLTDETWTGFMAPTLEGQYIIKNLALIACAIGIASHLKPLKKIKR